MSEERAFESKSKENGYTPFLQYPEFIEFKTKSSESENESSVETSKLESEERTPEEDSHKSAQTLKQALMGEILAKVKGSSPAFFENLVVDTLVKMGYGGSQRGR